MIFILIASSWSLQLHETYQKDWSSFVSAVRNYYFCKKTAYYSQFEAQFLLEELKIYDN